MPATGRKKGMKGGGSEDMLQGGVRFSKRAEVVRKRLAVTVMILERGSGLVTRWRKKNESETRLPLQRI